MTIHITHRDLTYKHIKNITVAVKIYDKYSHEIILTNI